LKERGRNKKEGGFAPLLKLLPPSPKGKGDKGGWGHHTKLKGFPEKSMIF
jgi:hypothetical protein